MHDTVTMSIPIVPVIDKYITQFISLDKTIPVIFTEPTKVIAEYTNSKVRIQLHIIQFFIKKND